MFKDMKKMDYVAPEMDEIKLIHNVALLEGSNEGNDEQVPGTGDPEEL